METGNKQGQEQQITSSESIKENGSTMGSRHFEQSDIERTINEDTLTRAIRGRMDAMTLTGEKLVEEHRRRIAHSLMVCGLTLIPSEHLTDNQFVVSRGVYDAAMRIMEGR